MNGRVGVKEDFVAKIDSYKRPATEARRRGKNYFDKGTPKQIISLLQTIHPRLFEESVFTKATKKCGLRICCPFRRISPPKSCFHLLVTEVCSGSLQVNSCRSQSQSSVTRRRTGPTAGKCSSHPKSKWMYIKGDEGFWDWKLLLLDSRTLEQWSHYCLFVDN